MTPGVSPATGPGALWRDALDALELDVAETEKVLLLLQAHADHAPELRATWTPPPAPLASLNR